MTRNHAMVVSSSILQYSAVSSPTHMSFKQRDVVTKMDLEQKIFCGLEKSELTLGAQSTLANTDKSYAYQKTKSVSFKLEPDVYSYSVAPSIDYESLFYKTDDFSRFKKDMFDEMVKAEVEKIRQKKRMKRRGRNEGASKTIRRVRFIDPKSNSANKMKANAA